MAEDYRTEKDSLGEMQVPADALYAAQTQRAVENFPISDLRFPRGFIAAMGLIKRAAARTNAELGLLDQEVAAAIVEAAQEVIEGEHDDQFPIDIFQTGSGTSTNMNTNEVIATLATRRLGAKVHPNDHVNAGQSSNDMIPTAMQVAASVALSRELIPSLETLRASLERKAREFDGLVKSGRTHLMDATPVRLGQEFGGFASQIEHGLRRLREAREDLAELPLGGTAVGTGINTHPEFARRTIDRIAEDTGLELREATDHFERQATRDTIVYAHGALNTLAVSLTKIANDLRWLASGPRAGLAEITLPATQPGSSIMPGKVNPVIPEAVTMVAAQVMGNHTTITVGGTGGYFELNVMMPVMAYALLQSIRILANASRVLAEKCVDGIEANEERITELLEGNLSLGTALAPHIGYDAAAALAKEAFREGRTVRELAREKGVLPADELDRVLDARSMTEPGIPGS
ncbi:MAG: aspartate ammonia-lyase [Gemmatimonadetes bacterium]|nr:class II fumarate hydratase [Gemmatimonadota bacterium]NIQ57834.1 class II fumarate hydratase [Gemmatimonadota bacterium]NIU77987.1 aspartate ammonia-lyase [Gammaproteobacteria bacterium]NIX47062.1 aspartate ammonia-lyase [Gemmatimonadota bacterium]NIY11440.1 aspartate ammonia-lyase [Gemmatimonadota bacterium]